MRRRSFGMGCAKRRATRAWCTRAKPRQCRPPETRCPFGLLPNAAPALPRSLARRLNYAVVARLALIRIWPCSAIAWDLFRGSTVPPDFLPSFATDDRLAAHLRRRRSRAARRPRLRRRPPARDERLPRAQDGPPAVPRRRGGRRARRSSPRCSRRRSARSSSGSSATKGSTSRRRSTSGTTRAR